MSLDPVVGLRFRVTHPTGRQETLLVDAERALIGSGAHCEVRLDPELAAHEHVHVYTDAGNVYFTTPQYGASRMPTLEGYPMMEGTWSRGQTLAIGNVQFQVEPVDIAAPKAKPPLWSLIVMIPIVGLSITAIAMAHTPRYYEAPIPDAPALLPPKDTAACNNVSPDQRAALAAEKLRIALAKRERSPFSPQDGFEAVLFFETAAACYRGASMAAEAIATDHAADVLRVKLEEDYRVRRVRLEHAYRVHDTPAAKRELAVLIPMTSQHRGPYTEWLAALDRAVTAEIDQRGRLQ
jgi:hypothetical protein